MQNKFDLTTIYNKDRPMSWSAISAFEWNPSQWYKKYVLKELQEETPELRFGKMIDEKVQKDRKFLPKLVRYPIQQHKMRTEWKSIPLIGFSDQYAMPGTTVDHNKGGRILGNIAIRDLKTGRKAWDQKRADETGQLTMYLFMLYLMNRNIDVAYAELYIDWLPTHVDEGEITFIKPVKIHTFKTQRTMTQILQFGQRIEDTWKKMEEYASREIGSVVHNRKDW